MFITWSTPGAHDELLQDADPLKPKRKQTNMPSLRKRTVLKSSLPKPLSISSGFQVKRVHGKRRSSLQCWGLNGKQAVLCSVLLSAFVACEKHMEIHMGDKSIL